jgi:hypothetical protein
VFLSPTIMSAELNTQHSPLTRHSSQRAGFAGPSGKPLPPPPFNDAPLDLLSVPFLGRERELSHIDNVLSVPLGDAPTRCVIYGMHGLGKSQLALQLAKASFDQRRYSNIFWISASTVEKLNQGFARLLNLIGHPDHAHPQQSARLAAARQWLEEPGVAEWLLVLDNVHRDTLNFLQEHLPRKNRRGNVLFTTRTESVAFSLAHAEGQRHEVVRLRAPGVQPAAKLLLRVAGLPENAIGGTPLVLSRPEKVVKSVACLPLVVSHAASFIRQSHKTLDDLLELYQNDRKIEVGSDPHIFSLSHSLTRHEGA